MIVFLMIIWGLALLAIDIWAATVVGTAATERGRSYAAWFFLSLLFSPVLAGVLLLLIGEQNPRAILSYEAERLRPCPFCAEKIQKAATFCRYCHNSFGAQADAYTGRAGADTSRSVTEYQCPSCGNWASDTIVHTGEQWTCATCRSSHLSSRWRSRVRQSSPPQQSEDVHRPSFFPDATLAAPDQPPPGTEPPS